MSSIGSVPHLQTTGASAHEPTRDMSAPVLGQSGTKSVAWTPGSTPISTRAQHVEGGLRSSGEVTLRERSVSVSNGTIPERTSPREGRSGDDDVRMQMHTEQELESEVPPPDPGRVRSEELHGQVETEPKGKEEEPKLPKEGLGTERVRSGSIHETITPESRNRSIELRQAARDAGGPKTENSAKTFFKRLGCVLAGCNWGQAKLLVSQGFGFSTARMLRSAHIPITLKTLPQAFHPTKLVGRPERFGAGQIHTVSRGVLQDGTHIILKPETSSHRCDPGTKSGIPHDKPQFGLRNVASYKLSDKLGFGLIPKSEMTVAEGRVQLAMSLAPGTSPVTTIDIPISDALARSFLDRFNKDISPGKPAKSLVEVRQMMDADPEINSNVSMELRPQLGIDAGISGPIRAMSVLKFDGERMYFNYPAAALQVDFTDPALRRDLTRLQLLDTLCGQVDRHSGNYLIQLDEAGRYLGLQGIDNDCAFGSALTEVATTFTANLKGADLPQVVDRETIEHFNKLTEADVRDSMQGLSEVEIKNTLHRLQEIKQHLASLPKGQIIEPEEYGHERLTPFFSNEKNSYVAREQGTLRDLTTANLVVA